jgi:two-component system OmpR family sensor kinase
MRLWIDELVDVARLQVGQELCLTRATTDLVALAHEAAAEYHETSEHHRLRVEATESELVGEWDAERLQRVLANLVSNAMKYSPDGGDVTIRVGREGDTAVVAVRDFGVGIPPGDLAHLFEQVSSGQQRSWAHRRHRDRVGGRTAHRRATWWNDHCRDA